MQKCSIEITSTAESDILDIFRYISQDKGNVAVRWVNEIERQIETLEKFPARCPIIPESDELGEVYHHLIYGNYRTIFKIDGSKVTIMRVIHCARLLDLGLFGKE